MQSLSSYRQAISLVMVLAAVAIAPTLSHAQPIQAETKPRALKALSQKNAKKIQEISAIVQPEEGEPDFRKGWEEVQQMERSCRNDKCNAYEMFQVYYFSGWIRYSLDDVPGAINYYKKALGQSPNMPLSQELVLMKTLAQLETQRDNLDEGLRLFLRWLEMSKVNGKLVTASDHYFEATLRYQRNEMREALKAVNLAVKMTEDNGKVPQKSWYDLQRALYTQKENYAMAVEILHKTERNYPDKKHWPQLAGLYSALGKQDEQLHAMDTAYLLGALEKEQQLLNLAYLYLGAEYPYRAARILEKGMKDKAIEKSKENLEILGRAYNMSKEFRKAIPYMSEAASKSKNGDLYSELAGLYLDLDDNKKAVDASRSALKKGDLKYAGATLINYGIAYFNLKEYTKAIEQFGKAAKIDKVKRQAQAWKRHAEVELERDRQLAAN